MINNRQGGRRRGRGGGQRQGGSGQGQRDSGNRIDSRARGNASQLYEKYKNMARDAQLSGDRVTTEYYLQFADHYFRVLSDQRGRFDDQGSQRRQRDDFDQFDGDDDFGDEGEQIRGDEQPRASEGGNARDERPRMDRQRGDGRDEGREGGREGGRGMARHDARDEGDRDRDRGRGAGNAGEPRRERRPARPVPVANDVEDVPATVEATGAADEAPAEPRRRGRPRKQRDDLPATPLAGGASNDADVDAGAVMAFEADRLPPSIAPIGAGDEGEDAPKPRRRRARASGEVTQAG